MEVKKRAMEVPFLRVMNFQPNARPYKPYLAFAACLGLCNAANSADRKRACSANRKSEKSDLSQEAGLLSDVITKP